MTLRSAHTVGLLQLGNVEFLVGFGAALLFHHLIVFEIGEGGDSFDNTTFCYFGKEFFVKYGEGTEVLIIS